MLHDIDADYSPQYVKLARVLRDKSARVAANTVYTSVGGKPQLLAAIMEGSTGDPAVAETLTSSWISAGAGTMPSSGWRGEASKRCSSQNARGLRPYRSRRGRGGN